MPDPEPLKATDADILRRTAAGDGSAFSMLVERHQPAVLRFLAAVTDDGDAAEDALQETFIAAWRAAASFRGEDSARAWLLTIARNAARRQRRRRSGEPSRFVPLDELATSAGWGATDDDFAARLDARDAVHAAFRALPAEEREILTLREMEGFTGDEAATILALTLPAAKSRLHRARLHFMARLREAT